MRFQVNKILKIVSILTIGAIVGCFVFIDNTDTTLWSEDFLHEYQLRVQSGRRFLQEGWSEAELIEMIRQENEENALRLEPILKYTANACMNGKDAKKLKLSEQVDEFIKSPCNPVILLPGIAGTSLQVEIDCYLLELERPDVFESCGWGTCNSWNILKKKPDSEYRLWISTTTSPMGIVQTSKKNHCFGDIVQLLYDSSKNDPKDRYFDVTGLKVTFHGNTPKTSSAYQCGLGAVETLTDDLIIKGLGCDYRGFQNMGTLLANMGYTSGLFYQAIPYDYRRDIIASKTPTIIKKTVENFYKITGKKTVILTHSLGSLYAVHTLNNLSQEWKDQYIATLSTFGAPYLGANKVARSNLGGDPGYLSHFLTIDVGINYYCQNKAMNTMSSIQDLYPKDTFFRFRNEPWMKELLERIQYERNYLEGKETGPLPMDWFPGPTEICTPGFSARTSQCQTHVTDLAEPFVSIVGKGYTSTRNDINDMLTNSAINSTLLKNYYAESQLPHLENLVHPGVPFIIVYGAFMNVESKFHYNKNPIDVVSATGDFYFPENIEFSVGDGTVMTGSAVTPAVKWIYEHKNNQINYATKLVEFCSSWDKVKISNIYDGVNPSDGRKTVTQSGYMGIPCACIGAKDPSNCQHSCMINDQYIIELSSNIIQTNEPSVLSGSTYSDTTLKTFLDNCVNLKEGTI